MYYFVVSVFLIILLPSLILNCAPNRKSSELMVSDAIVPTVDSGSLSVSTIQNYKIPRITALNVALRKKLSKILKDSGGDDLDQQGFGANIESFAAGLKSEDKSRFKLLQGKSYDQLRIALSTALYSNCGERVIREKYRHDIFEEVVKETLSQMSPDAAIVWSGSSKSPEDKFDGFEFLIGEYSEAARCLARYQELLAPAVELNFSNALLDQLDESELLELIYRRYLQIHLKPEEKALIQTSPEFEDVDGFYFIGKWTYRKSEKFIYGSVIDNLKMRSVYEDSLKDFLFFKEYRRRKDRSDSDPIEFKSINLQKRFKNPH